MIFIVLYKFNFFFFLGKKCFFVLIIKKEFNLVYNIIKDCLKDIIDVIRNLILNVCVFKGIIIFKW